MTDKNSFNDRIENVQRRSGARNSDSPRDRAARSVFESAFEMITDIFFFGWWAFFAGIAFCLFAGLAVLGFLGFDVEFFLAAAFVVMIAVGLAWHLWDS